MNLKERIRNGETVYGTMVRIQRNPAFCLIARDAGIHSTDADLLRTAMSGMKEKMKSFRG